MAAVAAREHALIAYATERLAPIPGLRIIGTAAEKAGVVSFVLDGIPPETVGKALEQVGYRSTLGASLRAADFAPVRARGECVAVLRVI